LNGNVLMLLVANDQTTPTYTFYIASHIFTVGTCRLHIWCI